MKLEAIWPRIEAVNIDIPIISPDNAIEEQLEQANQIIASKSFELIDAFIIRDFADNISALLQNSALGDDIVDRAINTMDALQIVLFKFDIADKNSSEIEKNKNGNNKSEGKSKIDSSIDVNSNNIKKSRNKSIKKSWTFPYMPNDSNLYPLDHKDFPDSNEIKVDYPGMSTAEIKKHIHAVRGILS